MIAYIDLPLRGTYTVNGHDILVVAMATSPVRVNGRPQVFVVFIDEDGSMGQAELSEVNINWRFDNNHHKWVDVDTGEDLGDVENDGDSPN